MGAVRFEYGGDVAVGDVSRRVVTSFGGVFPTRWPC